MLSIAALSGETMLTVIGTSLASFRLLGPIGLNILTRIFGLILAAIAVEIMANGLRELFPVLAG